MWKAKGKSVKFVLFFHLYPDSRDFKDLGLQACTAKCFNAETPPKTKMCF